MEHGVVTPNLDMVWLPRIIPWALALSAGTVATLWWLTGGATVELRLPGADRPPGTAAAVAIDLVGQVATGPGKPLPAEAGPFAQWPGFRGDGAGRSEETGLLKDLTRARILWEVEMGEGYAGPALRNGRVYVLDYVSGSNALRCLNAVTGEELWRRSYQVDVKRNHGMSRTIPAVSDEVAITLGPKCHLVAVNAEDGSFLWGKDLVAEYGTKVPPWYAGQCPLLRRGRLYVAPAGDKVLLTALDAKTGATIWEVPNPHQWKMTHSSVVEVVTEDRKTLVYCGSAGVIGVDDATGKVLWESTDWKVSIANVPSPVDLGDGRILFTGGYGAGGMIGRVQRTGDGYALRVEKRLGPGVMGSEQQTPVLLPDHQGVMAVIPSGEMIFMDPNGELRWRSGGANRFGSGPYLVADGAAYVLNDTGTLTAIATDKEQFQVLGSHRILLDGRECWGPMALADGRLYLRDLTRLFCLDLRAK
jgi:outer membrane protein assembly factor BamB